MVKEYTGVDKIIHDMIEDISEVCTDMRDKYENEYEHEVLLAAGLQASLTFTVSTLIAASISLEDAKSVLTTYYMKLTPDIEGLMKEYDKKN